MATKAFSQIVGAVVPSMEMHDLVKSATAVITDAQGRPVTQAEQVSAENPGYLTRMKQAAAKHPWIARAMIGLGTVGTLTSPVAAANGTIDFSFIGNIITSLLNGLTPAAPALVNFLDAWVGPGIEIIIILCLIGVAYALRDKIEAWAKKM